MNAYSAACRAPGKLLIRCVRMHTQAVSLAGVQRVTHRRANPIKRAMSTLIRANTFRQSHGKQWFHDDVPEHELNPPFLTLPRLHVMNLIPRWLKYKAPIFLPQGKTLKGSVLWGLVPVFKAFYPQKVLPRLEAQLSTMPLGVRWHFLKPRGGY